MPRYRSLDPAQLRQLNLACCLVYLDVLVSGLLIDEVVRPVRLLRVLLRLEPGASEVRGITKVVLERLVEIP